MKRVHDAGGAGGGSGGKNALDAGSAGGGSRLKKPRRKDHVQLSDERTAARPGIIEAKQVERVVAIVARAKIPPEYAHLYMRVHLEAKASAIKAAMAAGTGATFPALFREHFPHSSVYVSGELKANKAANRFFRHNLRAPRRGDHAALFRQQQRRDRGQHARGRCRAAERAHRPRPRLGGL